MSENNRSAKRRRVSSKHEPATTSKSASVQSTSKSSARKRARPDSPDEIELFNDIDGAHTGKRTKRSATKPMLNGTPKSSHQTTAGGASNSRKSTSKKTSESKTVPNGVESSENDFQDDDDEPRRSSRKRKVTAKGAERSWLPNGKASAQKDSASEGGHSNIDVTTDAEDQLLFEASATVTPSKKKRGRPPKEIRGGLEVNRKEQTPRKPGSPLKQAQKDDGVEVNGYTLRKPGRPRKEVQETNEVETSGHTPRKPGRPRKEVEGEIGEKSAAQTPKKPGRPPKEVQKETVEEETVQTPKKRGRPPKTVTHDGTTSRSKNSPFIGIQVDRPQAQAHTPSKRSRQVIWDDDEDELGKPNDQLAATPQSRKGKRAISKSADIFAVPSSPGDELDEDQDVVMGSTKEILTVAQMVVSPTVMKHFFEKHENQLDVLVKIALEKLSQKRPIPLTHLDEEFSKVYQLVEATVVAGEGNSMLIVGARGTGKTTLINKVLHELSRSQKEHFHVVRLNGFIQTDDKLALREIWRQLGKEMETEEEGGKSYADTLAMLLALLSHPDEIAGEHQGQVAKSVIFVMDEFDHFASHPRQTLLYNLLDIAQSRKAPIAVLGLTTKYDITESFEKRVKSRFSHRYVHLSLAKSLMAFQDICKSALLLQSEELSVEEKFGLAKAGQDGTKKGKKDTTEAYLTAWNDSVHALFTNPAFISSYIRPPYYLTKSVQAVLTSLLLPLSTLPANPSKLAESLLPPTHFLSSNTNIPLVPPPSSLPLLLPSLSDLQLSLLIAAARLEIIHDSDTCSFGMAYAEYVDLAAKARLQSSASGALASGAGTRVWGREVARGEWEALVRYGLVVPVSESGVATIGGLVKVDVKLEEIPGSVRLSTVMERWCKQI